MMICLSPEFTEILEALLRFAVLPMFGLFSVGGGKDKSSGLSTQKEGIDPRYQDFADMLVGSMQEFVGGGGMAPGQDLYQSLIRGEGLDPSKNPALARTREAARGEFEDVLGRSLNLAADYGGMSGIRRGSAGEQIRADAAAEAARGYGREEADRLYGAYEAEAGRRFEAPQALISMLTQAFEPLSKLRRSGGRSTQKSKGFQFSV